MVLKKNAMMILYFLAFSQFQNIFCAEKYSENPSTFWQSVIQEAFANSPQVQESKNNYDSALIAKIQNDYSWFPLLQFDIQQNLRQNRGDYLYILNQNTDSKNTIILNPFTQVTISQKLSGHGNLTFSAGYGFDYLIDRRAFLQHPQMQFNYSQSLGKGAFRITGNPEKKLLQEQMNYSKLTFTKELIEQLQSVIEKIGTFEALTAEAKYYDSLLAQYEAELSTAQEKNKNGLQSDLESYYALHQYSNTKNKLDEVQINLKNAEKEVLLLLPNITFIQIEKERSQLKNYLDTLFSSIQNDNESNCYYLERNLDSLIYYNILNQQEYNFQINELNYVPTFYTSSTLAPDTNLYYNYADWYKSFRDLMDYPYPLSFTITAGIKINLELPKAKKMRKELYELQNQTINKNYDSALQNQKRRIIITINHIQMNLEYLDKIEKEIIKESDFRAKRKKLFENNLITQNEYYQSETMFFYMYKDYISTFWEYINNQISIIAMSSESEQLLKLFLGESFL